MIIAGRRPCPAGTCCSGFSVLRCLGRACTLVAPTLLAFARRVPAPSQALKNAPTATFFTAPPSHPLHGFACMGLSPQKPSPDRGEARATTTGLGQGANNRKPIPEQVRVVLCCSRGRGGFFSPEGPLAREAVRRGAEAAGQWTLPPGVSLSACSETYHGAAEAKRSGAKAQPVVA